MEGSGTEVTERDEIDNWYESRGISVVRAIPSTKSVNETPIGESGSVPVQVPIGKRSRRRCVVLPITELNPTKLSMASSLILNSDKAVVPAFMPPRRSKEEEMKEKYWTTSPLGTPTAALSMSRLKESHGESDLVFLRLQPRR